LKPVNIVLLGGVGFSSDAVMGSFDPLSQRLPACQLFRPFPKQSPLAAAGNPMRPKILSPDEAVGLIVDSATVTVSASSGVSLPDAMLAALGERFRRRARPAASDCCFRSISAICSARRASIIWPMTVR
jgi:hypothetical protein